MICLKPIYPEGLKYDHIVGVGGIGSGMFFSLVGDHTLGRNESRMATLLPSKDFCKQHIIMHYIAVLLGAKTDGDFQSFPIGKVGNDVIGKDLVEKMKAAGMDTSSIHICEDYSTLFSVCYQYPDYTGGNITTENSASNQVSPEDIIQFFKGFPLTGNKEIVLAAPEVPVATRIQLLKSGRQRGSLTVASILSSEVEEFRQAQGFELVDILAVNIDEAGSIAKMNTQSLSTDAIVEECIDSLTAINPDICLLITDGGNGSYCYANNHLELTPVLPVSVISTAGAGDTFLAGTLTGLCCGLPLTKGNNDTHFSASPLRSAVELGTLLAALSVTSPDTIHSTANAELLYNFAVAEKLEFSPEFSRLIEMASDNSKNIL